MTKIIIAFHRKYANNLIINRNIYYIVLPTYVIMIIYPQINNLKIVVVPAIAILIVLGFYSYKSYNSIQEFNSYLAEENDVVATELFDMILDYHDLEIDNDSIRNQLEISRLKINSVLDSVQHLKPNISLVSNYKKQLRVLRNENRHILKLVDKLNQENELLKLEADFYATELDESNSMVSKFQVSTTKLNSVNSKLKKKNKGLNSKIVAASKVSPKITLVQAVKREKSDHSLVLTESARRTKKLNVSIKIPENKLAESGKRLYYMQVIDPNSNVVGDRGSVTIRGQETLINSKEFVIDYQNNEMAFSYLIEQNVNEHFVKGVYHVGLYDKDGLIENTTFTLQ